MPRASEPLPPQEVWEAAMRAHFRDIHSAQWGRGMSISQADEREAVANYLWVTFIGPLVERIEHGEYEI